VIPEPRQDEARAPPAQDELPRSLVVVGASAGGVEALQALVQALPADLPAAVLVVLHVRASSSSGLPGILRRRGNLPAEHPPDGAPLREGHIYVAPPDRHLLVRDGRVQVVRGPRENLHRPAIDPLFRSAAAAYGPRVVGVVLTGAGDDGSAGAAAVSSRGGNVVVQDPGDALYSPMPRNAIAADAPIGVVPLAEIPRVVVGLVEESAKLQPDGMSGHEPEGRLERETQYAALDQDAVGEPPPGELTPYACPACGGSLWRAPDAAVERVRCRVGHAFTMDALVESQAESLETALWTALRALEERASLTKRVARRLRSQGLERRAEEFDARSSEAERHAALLEKVLLGRDADSLSA
jgi:two-component system chemotaxis response regulator CheB